MSKFRIFTFLVFTLTITQIIVIFFVHSLKQEKLSDTQKHSPELISQSKFKPPGSSKPKGSSGAGSRRMSS
ncbi:hypothetical protein RIVM261_043470 [Rivularia sp. IAM M-261]|nr:hypothetical protein CAL7716_083810 [Calothrix sp. PCC 7716]GJD19391.1 hypothetical protein RIVM261_043470 [Rivularia sp. IAM M-261]